MSSDLPANRESDPLVDEVREWRRRFWERHGNDSARVLAELRQIEERWPEVAPKTPDSGK